jgi:HEAT repeat protein
MDDIDSLIARAASGGDAGAEGIDLLVARGAAVVPAIVAALDRGRAIPLWTAVLVALEDDNRVPALIAHLDHPNHGVTATLIRALGRCGDPAALESLLAELGRGRHLLAAVTALGELGMAQAIPALRSTAATVVGGSLSAERLGEVRRAALDNGDPSAPMLVATCAAALARLGDMSLAPAAIILSEPTDDVESFNDIGIRLDAVDALDALVAPGIAAALHAACDDPDSEIAEAAFDATARLGRASDVARWIVLAARNPERIDDVLRGIEAVTGEALDDVDLDGWWTEASRRFVPGICYVGGRPASPGMLLPGLRGSDVGTVKQELRARTGLRFVLDFFGGNPATPRELERIDGWWAEHRARFTPGALHRWGRSYDAGNVD